MSRFSKSEAEAHGWVFVHSADPEEVVTSSTQGEVRRVPGTHVAEKYHSIAGGPSQLIHEEGETMGKLLERIYLFEETQKRIHPPLPPQAVPVDDTSVASVSRDDEGNFHVDEEARVGTVTVAQTEDGDEIRVTESEWAARDRADTFVVTDSESEGGQRVVVLGGSTPEVGEAVEARDEASRDSEDADKALPGLGEGEVKQVDLDPSELIDAPGATGTGHLIVREDEFSVSEVQERKQAEKVAAENERVAAAVELGSAVEDEGDEEDAPEATETTPEDDAPEDDEGPSENPENPVTSDEPPADEEAADAEEQKE